MNIELVEFNNAGALLCYQNWQDIETQKGFNFIPEWASFNEYVKLFKINSYLLNCLIFDIELKNYVGHITISKKQKPDIAIWIFKEFRNKGYGKQALKKAINSFYKLKKETLYAGIYKDNVFSQKLFTSLGFIEIGREENEKNIFTDELTYQVILKL